MELATQIRGPVAVIGDVHGQVEKLLAVLEQLRNLPDFDRRWIVFIGDFVDRGPDSKAALDVVCDLMLQHRRTTAVCGNHEFAMAASLKLIPTPEYSNWSDRWLDHYGADATFDSYGAAFGDLDELAARLPDPHRDLLTALPWCVEHSDYLFVHAGLDPNTPLSMQLPVLRHKDFSLNRPQWLCSKSLAHAEIPADCPFTVVSGHVQVPQVHFGRKRILTDTTGGVSGDLSCVLLPEQQIISSGRPADGRKAAQGKGWRSFWK